jgi:cytochrome c oxidase cbb3-type subunit 3
MSSACRMSRSGRGAARGPVSTWLALAVIAVAGVSCRGKTNGGITQSAPPVTSDLMRVGPVPGAPEPSPPENPLEGDREALQKGRRLFMQYNCGGCHGDHGGGGMGPSLRDPDWIYGSDPGRVFGSIAQGRAHGMPSWGTQLPSDQVWQLVAYIRTLGTALEPEPPK